MVQSYKEVFMITTGRNVFRQLNICPINRDLEERQYYEGQDAN